MSVLVWIEQENGVAVPSCWEALGAASEAASDLGTPLVAFVAGADTDAAAARALSLGADRVLTVTSPMLEHYRLSTYVEGLKSAIDYAEATIVLTSATIRGRELSAAVAFDLNAGLAVDAIDLEIEEGKLVATCPVYSGNILTDIRFNSSIQVASVRPRAFAMPSDDAAGGSVEVLDVSLNEEEILEKVVGKETTESGEIALTDADKIVSGGRGVAQDPELGFKLVADLAKVIGAAVGASRAAVDAGYIPYKHQVGQTGKTVSPDLYIAAGISGAIQHLAGMGTSKTIVAINKDADAPIFERAHFGVVADLFELLPVLTNELNKRLN